MGENLSYLPELARAGISPKPTPNSHRPQLTPTPQSLMARLMRIPRHFLSDDRDSENQPLG